LKLETNKILKGDLKKDYINTFAFSPDGKYVVSGCTDSTVRIWDVATGAEIKKLEVASKAVLLTGSNVVSAKHCQDQDEMKVYTLKQVYKKRTKKRKHSKNSTSISRKK